MVRAMERSIGTIVVVLVIAAQHVDGCLDGYVHFENSCYHFSHDTETWTDAEVICKMDSGYLAEISFQRENDFIKSIVNGTGGGGWIGGADLNVEGTWKWWGTRTQLAYTNWRKGEPNNDRKDENCMQIEASGLWNDLPCHQLMRYICEMPDEIQQIVG